MRVSRAKISGSMLSRLGARCVMMTKAMPGSAGIALNRYSSASTPPAEAPTPTMGKDLSIDSPVRKGKRLLGRATAPKLRRALMNSKRLPLTCGEMHRRFAARQPLLRPVERFAGELNFLAQSQNLHACLRDQFDHADQPCAMLGINRPLHGPGLCGRYRETC